MSTQPIAEIKIANESTDQTMDNPHMRKKVSVRVSGCEGTPYRAHPVTLGVPFGDGELAAGTPLSLTDGVGNRLPIQTETLTTWGDDLQFVKWLLLDMQADLPEGGEKEFFLEFLGDDPPAEPEERVQVEEDGEFLVVEPVELCRRYGMMRYGNMVCSHSSAVGHVYLLYKDTDPEKALRHVGTYNNEAVDQIMAVWGHFARTGKREHGLIAQNYSRCVADVGFVHAYPGHPENPGGFPVAAAAWWNERRTMSDRELEVRPDAESAFSLGRLSTGPHPE